MVKLNKLHITVKKIKCNVTNFSCGILSLVFQQLFYLFILFSFYLLLVVVNVQCFKSDSLGLSGSVRRTSKWHLCDALRFQ